MLNGMLIGIIVFTIIYPFIFQKKTLWHQIITGLIVMYGGVVSFLTMSYNPPKYWNITLEGTKNAFNNIDFIPFVSSIEIFKNCQLINYYKPFILLVGGNLIMLMPLALLVPLINREKFKLKQIIVLAMCVSFSIECLQLLTNILNNNILRAVEIDDFIQNVSGCILAYLIFDKLKLIDLINKTAIKLQLN